jgi:hypothetical protein
MLLKREVGDNLIKKYTTKVILESFIPFVELAFVAIRKHTDQRNTTIIGILNAIMRWMISLRNVNALFSNKADIYQEEILHLSFDANGWYLNEDLNKQLADFDIPCSYRIFYAKNELKDILQVSDKLHGDKIKLHAGKLLNQWGANKFWRNCEKFCIHS